MDPDLVVINNLPALIELGLNERDKAMITYRIAQTGHDLILGLPAPEKTVELEAYLEATQIIHDLLSFRTQ